MSKKEKEKLPEIDESQLTEEQKAELAPKPFPWGRVIFIGVIALLMAVCFIVIFALGGPVA